MDRAIWQIDAPYRFLLAAGRIWVSHARAGRCPCSALQGGFTAQGLAPAIGDFSMAMAILDREALSVVAFSPRGCQSVGEGEARLLPLFAAALSRQPAQVRRIAATLVHETAVANLATAAERVAYFLAAAEQDR